MYKSILLLLGFLCAFNASAQPFTNRSTGFEADYLSPSSCLNMIGATNGGYAYIGGNVQSVTSGSPLTINSKSGLIPGDAPAFWDLYFTYTPQGSSPMCSPMKNTIDGDVQEDSNYYSIDMSLHPTIIVYARASAPAVVDFSLAYSKGWQYPISTFSDGLQRPVELTTTLKAYEIDFSEWAHIDKVNLFGLVIREPDVTVTIEKIQFGSAGNATFNYLTGKLFADQIADCLFQAGEKGIKNVLVKASSGTQNYWGYTNNDGVYTIPVDSGSATYTITPVLTNAISAQLYTNDCTAFKTLETDSSKKTFCCADFAISVRSCALLSVEINSDRRRRCFRNNTTVSYTNNGTITAASPVVKVVYPQYVVPVSSEPAWSSKIGDTLIYNLSALAPESRGFIHLIDSVVCGNESIRNLVQCTKAFISPKSQCETPNASWDGSSVSVTSSCENGEARFTVKNNGSSMAGTSEFRIYSNDTLVFQSTFQLESGNTFMAKYPGNGGVIRLEADQRPYHPGRSTPRAFVEACGAPVETSASESRVLSVPQDDLDEEVAYSCLPILDSYDPNDKSASPVGMTEDHLVKAGERIQYTIRFQNTGSDVAYKVKVVDVLDANLDIASFVKGASSHPYTLDLTHADDQTVLNFMFNNINLKDSTTSESESHGFVSFYINSKEGLADGNTLHNKADIFFDYNSAIVTNVVNHTIGTYTVTDLTKGNSVQIVTGLFDGNTTNSVQRVTLYPNPAADQVQVKLDQQFTNGQLTILDLSGHEVQSNALTGEITSVSLARLSSGLYMYKVQSQGEFVGVGKLVVK